MRPSADVTPRRFPPPWIVDETDAVLHRPRRHRDCGLLAPRLTDKIDAIRYTPKTIGDFASRRAHQQNQSLKPTGGAAANQPKVNAYAPSRASDYPTPGVLRPPFYGFVNGSRPNYLAWLIRLRFKESLVCRTPGAPRRWGDERFRFGRRTYWCPARVACAEPVHIRPIDSELLPIDLAKDDVQRAEDR